jgi:acetyl-CoA carboxylase biotin carboxyl carrier protein
MDFKEIQELIKLVSRLGIGEVSVKEGDFKITVKSVGAGVTPVVMQSQPNMIAAPATPSQAAAPGQLAEKPAASSAPTEVKSNLIAIKSPMVGTFYRAASPDKPPFIKVGDEISVGSKVCIIEAMKLFNEIESEIKGKIVKVLVEDKSPVEYDQELFLVDPS